MFSNKFLKCIYALQKVENWIRKVVNGGTLYSPIIISYKLYRTTVRLIFMIRRRAAIVLNLNFQPIIMNIWELSNQRLHCYHAK